MKRPAIALSCLFAACCTSLAGAEWNLADAPLGKLPQGWTAAQTGEGAAGQWQVIADDSVEGGKVLAQVSMDSPRPLFNVCVMNDVQFGDIDLSVRMKPLRGKIDQGGGPVWRYKDANNYYTARMNPLELNFRVYKVVAGKRTQLGTADVDADDELELKNKWHTIRVVHRGNHIQCSLGGEVLLDVKDDAIAQPGKIGLWAKADAVTAFDALKAQSPQQ